ncbi:MAG: hypothetical protein IJV97_05785 [Alphaproteobacteria bacterium]|nr:hypothetical protein [Alphaproteobacteria bacterium]
MKETISLFVKDFSFIERWFYPLGNKRSLQEVEAMYQVIRTMWFDYRDLFPNKGTYKTVRRLFVKYAAEAYLEARFQGKISLYEMSPELLQEMRFKSRQGWLSKSTFYWIERCIIEDNYPVRDTAKREKLLRML